LLRSNFSLAMCSILCRAAEFWSSGGGGRAPPYLATAAPFDFVTMVSAMLFGTCA
jgi:hypothetical protein